MTKLFILKSINIFYLGNNIYLKVIINNIYC